MAAWPGVAIDIEEDTRAARELAEFSHHLAKPAQIGIVEFKAVLGDRRRLAKVRGEIDVAGLADRESVRCQRAGHADGQRAGAAKLGVGFAVAQIHVAARCGRGGCAAVDRRESAVRLAD